jgi:type II secretory pathway pseudopilin PulG
MTYGTYSTYEELNGMRELVRRQEGLTWIEWVVLIALVGIISALAIPRLRNLYERGLEKATKANIGAIKSAISIYYGDHEGVWPTTLDVNDHTPGYGFGNYLDSLPGVKATHPSDPVLSPAGNQVTYKAFSDEPSLGQADSQGTGWRYDGPLNANTGRIWVNNSYTDTEGVSYTTYGYQ